MTESETNKIYSKNFGTRAEVYADKAYQTRGGLTKDCLFLDGNGVLQSRRQVESLKNIKKIKSLILTIAVKIMSRHL